MKNLTIKYSRRDFFGTRIYTEDTKENFTKADLTKAFLFLSKNNDAAKIPIKQLKINKNRRQRNETSI